MTKKRAPRNRTLTLTDDERQRYASQLVQQDGAASPDEILDKTIHQDVFAVLDWLPEHSIDLLFVDPPYNMAKSFNGRAFDAMSLDSYEAWMESWFVPLMRALKPTASVYVCGDWRSSAPVQRVMERHLTIRSRITWAREKGRGSKSNWKNNSEDIWFGTVSDEYTFNVHAVKVRKQVIAPYRDSKGRPKDWEDADEGRYRLTHPSNIWDDISVPFWSMPENTDHPTQKAEKLLAKIILASSNPGDFVFDPFAGVGTTAVVAKKLGRHFAGVEIDLEYCCLTEKRLALAEDDQRIQGYDDGIFWERNSGR